MNDFIFTSYCFGEKYIAQQERLKESVLSIYPDANLHFFNESEEVGKPKFQESLYGYKVQLVRDCLEKGFKKIVYLDTAICLEGKVDHWLELAAGRGVLAAVDRQTLDMVSSDAVLKYTEYTREQAREINLVGGSIYVFDFDTEICMHVFDAWEDLEKKGLFGTQDDLSHDRLQGHRMDETCMAFALYLNGMRPMTHEEMKYAYQHPETGKIHANGWDGEGRIVTKRHFK